MYKALILDDERPVRVAIAKLGNFARFRIEAPMEAENGRDALALMQRHVFDICFVDMQMPVMDGAAFLRQASSRSPDTAFIVISGYDDFSYVQNALRCGAVDYLLKPIVKEELDAAIEKAIRKNYPDADFSAAGGDDSITAEEVLSIIRRKIEQDYHENIQLSDFAGRYFFSKEYLSRLFKAKFGCTIYEYLIRVRMEHAQTLLLDPERRILDIARSIGYSDTNYFSKAFRNFCGRTPSEFRRENGSVPASAQSGAITDGSESGSAPGCSHSPRPQASP
ncbi:response regulator transcription factor [Lachnoclostridium sp. Marseille-P6806]|uniref:response regulator transcription factor n=1 Tax=Lachnoclostridium sp. Marseille-P6806 TaxID=2364793 RepID=UPI0013EF0AB0|nr:helix-turn-helix domain-containing protein [Lachnoclostridium sp. Marseille-P6806]